MKIRKGISDIATLDDWYKVAPPKHGMRQWVDWRSAKELARRYLDPASRNVLQALLTPTFGTVSFLHAEPECHVSFDSFGGPRQCDLVISATSTNGPLIIHIEGKADESFNRLVGEAFDQATGKSNIALRIGGLSKNLFGIELSANVRALRYQLLYSTAAVLEDARLRKVSAALFLVHEFHSHATSKKKLDANSADFQRFLGMFSLDRKSGLNSDFLVGPVRAASTEWNDIPLYFGKIVTHL